MKDYNDQKANSIELKIQELKKRIKSLKRK